MASGQISALLGKAIDTALHRPRLAAILLGAVAACGFPPLSLWPLTVIAVAVLAWLLFTAADWRKASWIGWCFGAGHFTLANNWIAAAFTYQEAMPHLLGWLAVPLLALYLAIYPALASLGAKLIAGRRAGFGVFGAAFTGCWIISEWLRSWVFTGFAWDPLGLAFLGGFQEPGIAAILPWVGTYGLSGIVIAISTLLALCVSRRLWLSGAACALMLAAGMHAPFQALFGERAEGTLAFTLVQPDTRQDDLNDPSKFEAQFLRTAMLTRKQEGVGKRLILWPESGIPDYLRDGYPQRYYNQMTAGGDPAFARFRIGRVVDEGGMLLTGAVDLEIENGRAYGARNAVTAINENGEIVAGYDKAHLVPYGEYLALRWLLEPLGATRLVAGTIDFIPGPGPQTLDLGEWGRVSVQICYEIIFSGDVFDPDNRPDYIFNPSNEGWFGSWGPPQFFAQARMRAIEEGLPVLRSTTTGISGVIDADGVVRDTIPMHRASRLDGLVPPAKPPTLFAQLGNILPLGLALLAIVLAAGMRSYLASGKRDS
ncbi:apolipoprotein N-acyltransferase [Pontixanthobacter sp.]|uniref:apolipoprotein N-acyltransferase n=1 Tax=Pontixanthobacter sp. TaxID=2792078 RepID=UPI003C7E57E4